MKARGRSGFYARLNNRIRLDRTRVFRVAKLTSQNGTSYTLVSLDCKDLVID